MFLVGADNLIVALIGLVLEGVALAMTVIPIFPEMLEAIEVSRPQIANNPELTNVSAGIFNVMLGIGESLGPVTGSVLNEAFGFTSSQVFISTLVTSYCLLYLVLCGGS